MNISHLLIGGNEGDRIGTMAAAREHIEADAGTISARSSLYETAAWGKTDQPDFVNQALELRTELDAAVLMGVLLTIEEKMGRKRLERFGSRIIDIDILFFNDSIIRQPGLIIPHPELPNRRFALTPLEEIAGSFVHPVLGRSVRELLKDCSDTLAVKKLMT